MKLKLLIIGLLLTSVSCTSRKQARLKAFNLEMMNRYWSNQSDYDYLSIRSKLAFTEGESTTHATVSIRMKKDSVLWASIGFMGLFEAARVLITTDSVKMINRLDNTYLARSTAYLKELLNMEVELNEMQAILLGNAPFEAAAYQLITKDSISALQAEKGHLVNTIQMNEDFKTYRSDLQSKERNESAHLRYDAYQTFGNMVLPSEVIAKVFANDTFTKVELNYQSVKNDPIKQFPFTVPSNFAKL